MPILKTFLFFIFAGLCEIAGGYLIWLYFKERASIWYMVFGIAALSLYGVVATFQPTDNFGKVYAAYGGVFIVLSLLWGWKVDGQAPDYYMLLGSAVIFIGVVIIFFGNMKISG